MARSALVASITVRYSAVDGFRKTRRFTTIELARKFAQRNVGKTPEIGGHYAVSADGIGTIRCSGCTLADLFPATVAAAPAVDYRIERRLDGDDEIFVVMAGDHSFGAYDSRWEAEEHVEMARQHDAAILANPTYGMNANQIEAYADELDAQREMADEVARREMEEALITPVLGFDECPF